MLASCTSVAAQAQHAVPSERMFAMTLRPPENVPSGIVEVTRDKVTGNRTQAPLSLKIDRTEVARIRPGETARLYVAAGDRSIEITELESDDASGNQSSATTVPVNGNSTIKLRIVRNTGRYELRLITAVRNKAEFEKAYAYDGEDGSWVDVSPPPENALQPTQISSALSFSHPTNWPVRAIYISTQGVFEFDRRGNVLKAASPSDTELGQILQNDQPVWPTATIYYLFSKASEQIGAGVLDSPRGLILSSGNRVCPVYQIAGGYRALKEISTPILDGDCSKAVRRQIGHGKFWVYPASLHEQEPELYWSVQYFDEPVQPMRNASGQCVLYCDDASQKAAEIRSEVLQ